MAKYYDKQGNVIPLLEWADKFEDRKYKEVARDMIDGVLVSTVWLGMDHGYGKGAPLIFETMVFRGPLDKEMERYSTESDALVGHLAMVERVKNVEANTSQEAPK